MARKVGVAGLLAVGVVVLQALLILWYAWPSEKIAPRDLPVVVAGPARRVAAVHCCTAAP